MKAYNLVLSDGKHVRVEAHSAADAIGSALKTFRGFTVERCFQGFDGQSKHYPGGGIEFEVPEHQAVPMNADLKRPKRVDDTTLFPFFDEVIGKSPQAKS